MTLSLHQLNKTLPHLPYCQMGLNRNITSKINMSGFCDQVVCLCLLNKWQPFFLRPSPLLLSRWNCITLINKFIYILLLLEHQQKMSIWFPKLSSFSFHRISFQSLLIYIYIYIYIYICMCVCVFVLSCHVHLIWYS